MRGKVAANIKLASQQHIVPSGLGGLLKSSSSGISAPTGGCVDADVDISGAMVSLGGSTEICSNTALDCLPRGVSI